MLCVFVAVRPRLSVTVQMTDSAPALGSKSVDPLEADAEKKPPTFMLYDLIELPCTPDAVISALTLLRSWTYPPYVFFTPVGSPIVTDMDGTTDDGTESFTGKDHAPT